MESYAISIILGIVSSILICLFRRNYKLQDKKLSGIEHQLNAFGQLLLFLKIQNQAQNTALQSQWKNGYKKAYDKELKKLMEQENFQKVG